MLNQVESAAHLDLQRDIAQCELCPRLVEHREHVARVKRRAYRDCGYWGRPVPSLGKVNARLLIVGLAPGAHGANRTGRMFTGDRSGDFLYPTLHRFGFCSQAESADRKDGLELVETYITAALHCVPPGNKPQSEEMSACRPFLIRELALLHRVRVVVALGGIAWQAYLRARKEMGGEIPQPKPKFGHGVTCELEGRIALIASYHPSQQNTQTGRLTQTMFDEIFATARKILLTT